MFIYFCIKNCVVYEKMWENVVQTDRQTENVR
jgi:hypothetical protein